MNQQNALNNIKILKCKEILMSDDMLFFHIGNAMKQKTIRLSLAI